MIAKIVFSCIGSLYAFFVIWLVFVSDRKDYAYRNWLEGPDSPLRDIKLPWEHEKG